MNEHLIAQGMSFQGLGFRYTERGTLLITIDGSHQRELNPREAADLLTYLNNSQGDLFNNAREGDMSTWPKMPPRVMGKSEIAGDVLDSYELKNAYSEDNSRKHRDGG